MKTIFVTILLCVLMVRCTSKPKHNPIVDTINSSIGINDTLGLSLYPEYPVYSTRQKQVTFVLHNNSGTDIGLGGYYSYTYEDEKGIWRDAPMQLIVFAEEIMLQQGSTYYYNAELFRHIPGRYRFFLTIRRNDRKHTLMAEFQLQNDAVEFFKVHSDNQQKDTLPPDEVLVDQPVFRVIDQMPEFPGGMDKLLQFINDNIQYPAEARKKGIQGRVTVQFIVDEDGHITEPNIVRSVDPFLDKEALRIIKTLPQWKPGTLKGKAVKVKYTVPVTFRLDKTKEIPQAPQSMTQTLHPVSRNIPIGKNMNPDSLSMKTEYACYPPSTTEVRIFVINHS
jgi:TonB family protein